MCPPTRVFNRQRKYPLDGGFLERVAHQVLSKLSLQHREVSIVVVSNARMKKLNTVYRGVRATTDVLSFADSGIEGYLGDVFISAEQAAENARLQGHSYRRELAFLVLHGLLHLAGYDHETDNGQMGRLERGLRRAPIFSV